MTMMMMTCREGESEMGETITWRLFPPSNLSPHTLTVLFFCPSFAYKTRDALVLHIESVKSDHHDLLSRCTGMIEETRELRTAVGRRGMKGGKGPWGGGAAGGVGWDGASFASTGSSDGANQYGGTGGGAGSMGQPAVQTQLFPSSTSPTRGVLFPK